MRLLIGKSDVCGQLENGSTATVTMGAGDTVIHIEVTYLCEQKGPNMSGMAVRPMQAEANIFDL